MYSRVRSFSCSSLLPLPSSPYALSLRQMHGCILHPRAPKIRHLNASHTLLMDMEEHIQKVQELENKVLELEQRLQLREANKTTAQPLSSASFIRTELSAGGLVSEAEQAAFQQRLREARQKAEVLAAKRSEEENNILRSWHSKRLRQALESLSAPSDPQNSLKLLANPDQSATEESLIFSSLDAMVNMANITTATNTISSISQQTEENFEHAIEKLKSLIVDKENSKICLEGVKSKLRKASDTCDQCLAVLAHVQASRRQLQTDIALSQSVLSSLQSGRARQRCPSLLWVYGPNPLFAGARDVELDQSLRNQFVVAMQQKLDISQIHAEINLSTAQHLVRKYSARSEHLSRQLETAKEAIEAQIRRLTALRPSEAADSLTVKPVAEILPRIMEQFIPEKTPREI